MQYERTLANSAPNRSPLWFPTTHIVSCRGEVQASLLIAGNGRPVGLVPSVAMYPRRRCTRQSVCSVIKQVEIWVTRESR